MGRRHGGSRPPKNGTDSSGMAGDGLDRNRPWRIAAPDKAGRGTPRAEAAGAAAREAKG